VLVTAIAAKPGCEVHVLPLFVDVAQVPLFPTTTVNPVDEFLIIPDTVMAKFPSDPIGNVVPSVDL
jgi:hypothetical protein